MKTTVPLYVMLLAAAALLACKTATPFAKLQSAVVNDQYDATPSSAAVRIVRADSSVTPRISLQLRSGDSVATSRTARVVLDFAAGYEVTLDTGSVIYMLDGGATAAGGAGGADSFAGFSSASRANTPMPLPTPLPMRLPGASPAGRLGAPAVFGAAATHDHQPVIGGYIFLRIGRAFIKRLRSTRDTIDTRTPQAVLHDHGTEYLVTVSGTQTSVRVVTGEVIARSADGRWNSVQYGPGSGGVLRVDASPERTTTATRVQLEAELGWVRRVERLTKVTVPSVDSMTEQQARDALARVGLRVLFKLQRETSDAAVGRVIETMPASGERVSPDTYVTLILAKAPRGELCVVPDITEKTEGVAKQLLTAARFTFERISSGGEIDVVTSQREKAGSRMRCGSTVHYAWGRIG